MPHHNAGSACPATATGAAVILALGSNRCHGRYGRPTDILGAAVRALADAGVADIRLSPIMSTAPIGPSDRRFANAVLAGQWRGTPRALLHLAKKIEHDFGRRRGQRWGARVLDIDIIAFGAARVRAPELVIPHPRLAERQFVLVPMLAVAPDWRHPATGLTVRHLAARLQRRRPLVDPSGTTV